MADWRDGSTMLSPRDRVDDDDCVELVDVGVIGREPDEEEDACRGWSSAGFTREYTALPDST